MPAPGGECARGEQGTARHGASAHGAATIRWQGLAYAEVVFCNVHVGIGALGDQVLDTADVVGLWQVAVAACFSHEPWGSVAPEQGWCTMGKNVRRNGGRLLFFLRWFPGRPPTPPHGMCARNARAQAQATRPHLGCLHDVGDRLLAVAAQIVCVVLGGHHRGRRRHGFQLVAETHPFGVRGRGGRRRVMGAGLAAPIPLGACFFPCSRAAIAGGASGCGR